MKVLLLAQAFPPHPEVGALRADNLTRALLKAEHQVVVVTERPASPPAPDVSLPDGLRIVYVEPGPSYAQRLRMRLGALVGPAVSSTATASPTSPAPRRGYLRRLALSLLSLPDTDQHLIRPFIRAALRTAREERPDVIYTSAPPFSLHLAGWFLKRRLALPWVAEFRDPWNHPWTHRTALENGVAQWLDRRLEHQVLRRADLIVTVTEASRQLIGDRLPLQHRQKLLMVRNGIPDWTISRDERQVRPAARPFMVCHAGSLYMHRDPLAFLDGASRLVRARRLGPADLQIHLMGRFQDYQGQSVAALVAERGLSDIVRLSEWLPHQQVRRSLLEAGALLLFAQQQPLQVPNKLYEYLATEAPILAFVDRGGESDVLLRELGGAELLYDPDPDAVAAILGRLLDRAAGPAPRLSEAQREARKQCGTAPQMARLVAEMEKRLSRPSQRGGTTV